MAGSRPNRRDMNRSLTGRIGRVSGLVGPGTVGEVMVPFQGGSSAFHAHPYDDSSVYPVGERVLVMYFEPPQTVYVEQLPEFLREDG
ncbi:hypothetical protein CVV68_13520 [Arthrobacter livingstonensis]|uniref:Uncharacterized protein n=2 Tax=Arthrobacter livingstonensis TaxID=670078 RepID=A0A2V5LA35_9MICC|nr:hypothetical protein CVV68_13520 [Arthrobacter livingstonensis]